MSLWLASSAHAAGKPTAAPTSTDALDRAPKLALAIGIDTYSRGWPNKQNAVADAKAVAGELMRNGYKVALLENPDARTLARALKQFLMVDGDKPEARLLIWYSGQTHTLSGRSYLVPADSPLPNREADFKAAAVSFEDYVTLLRRSSAAQIYTVVDAPMAATDFVARVDSDRDPSTSPYMPVRQFLSSAAVGQAAADDGVFRRTFLRALAGINNADTNKDKLLTAEEIGPYIQNRVGALTKNHQTPIYGRLGGREYAQGDYAFTLGAAYRDDVRNIPRAKNSGDAQEIEEMVWSTVQKTNDPRRLELFLKLYPDGVHAEQAFAQLTRMTSPVATATARLPIADDEKAVPVASPPAKVPMGPVSYELLAPPAGVAAAPKEAVKTELVAVVPPEEAAAIPEPVKVAAVEPAPEPARLPTPKLAAAAEFKPIELPAPTPAPVPVVIPAAPPAKPANFLPPSVAAAIVPAPVAPPPAPEPPVAVAMSIERPKLIKPSKPFNPFDQDSVAAALPILASTERFDSEMAEPEQPMPVVAADPEDEPQSQFMPVVMPVAFPLPQSKPAAVPAMAAVVGPAVATPRALARIQPTALTTPSGSAIGRYVQLGAYKTQELAERNLKAWKEQFPNLFEGSIEPIVALADLGEKGTYYRVRVGGFDDLRQAADFCSVFRGGPRDCYIVPEH